MSKKTELNWSALYPNLFEKYEQNDQDCKMSNEKHFDLETIVARDAMYKWFQTSVPKFDPNNIPDLDIELVMAQTSCTREKAVESLIKNKGDIVNTIMELS